MTDTFFEALTTGAKELNIDIKESEAEKLFNFYQNVVNYNEKVNLTSVLEENDFVVKHILDSISAVNLIPKNATVLDIGAGAGFPSIPLKIMRPDIKLIMMDALNKRVDFLKLEINELGLQNTSAVHLRAEEGANNGLRKKADVVVIRAVASTSILLELSSQLIKTGGLLINYKGRDLEDVDNAKNAEKILGYKREKTITFDLPGEAGRRNLIVYKKIADTDKMYPRLFGKIKNKPL